ncbi:MAG: hypothetical protein IKN55_02385 [Oscillospiraceae bacterium]|nr:hypothetical protein [Oscillospiraceae bacterium]
MHLVFYRKSAPDSSLPMLERAAARAHLLRRTAWWDAGLLLLLAGPGTLLYWYAPMLRTLPALVWLTPISSSPWEQLKPMFWTVSLMAVIRYFCTGRLQNGILTTYAAGLFQAMGGIISGYYVISGIWGENIPLLMPFLYWVHALVLVLYLRRSANQQKHSNLPGVFLLSAAAVCFILFTYHTPQIGLFQ